jgi:hypothetical protein
MKELITKSEDVVIAWNGHAYKIPFSVIKDEALHDQELREWLTKVNLSCYDTGMQEWLKSIGDKDPFSDHDQDLSEFKMIYNKHMPRMEAYLLYNL